MSISQIEQNRAFEELPTQRRDQFSEVAYVQVRLESGKLVAHALTFYESALHACGHSSSDIPQERHNVQHLVRA